MNEGGYGKEHVSGINVSISFNKLVIDGLNLQWAIENILEGRPSKSKDEPMQVAMGQDNKYYLLDGYHRLVEAVINGKTSTKGVLLNKSMEEMKKMDMIGVACVGGFGDKYCNNFKTKGSIEDIKKAFQNLNEVRKMVRKILREEYDN
jgi:hypothetical protein